MARPSGSPGRGTLLIAGPCRAEESRYHLAFNLQIRSRRKRPAKDPERDNFTVTVRMPLELRDRLNDFAAMHNCSANALCVAAIEDILGRLEQQEQADAMVEGALTRREVETVPR